jgi:hypothetical protein
VTGVCGVGCVAGERSRQQLGPLACVVLHPVARLTYQYEWRGCVPLCLCVYLQSRAILYTA